MSPGPGRWARYPGSDRWANPPEGPAPGSCPECGGELEVDDERAVCPGCGFEATFGDDPRDREDPEPPGRP